MRYLILLATSFGLNAALPHHNSDLIALEGEHFSILYNCSKRGFEHYTYVTRPDTGNAKRKSNFTQDDRLPAHCRQKSTGTYKGGPYGSLRYDRGHGVPANHFDFDKRVSDSTNVMSNIVPQEASLNRRGLWRHTDKIIECLRDEEAVTVYGGVIWGNDKSNDYFIESHGVPTPDHLYKIIVRANGEKNAWIFPNNSQPTQSNGARFLVPVIDIEMATRVTFELSDKHTAAQSMFSLPTNCNYS